MGRHACVLSDVSSGPTDGEFVQAVGGVEEGHEVGAGVGWCAELSGGGAGTLLLIKYITDSDHGGGGWGGKGRDGAAGQEQRQRGRRWTGGRVDAKIQGRGFMDSRGWSSIRRF